MSNTPTDTNPDSNVDRDEPNRNRDTDRDVLNTGAVRWLSAIAALVGLWIVASPFVYEATETVTWNLTLVGTGIFLLAGYNFYRMSQDRLASVGIASLAVLLGLWVLVSPYLMEVGSDELATSMMVSGIVVAALSGYNAYANNKADTTNRAATRT